MDLTKWTDPIHYQTTSANLEKLCLSLVRSDSERDVVDILKRTGLWESEKNWDDYGDNENNFAVIGNQQSAPESAIVEKIINSVDALLMRECLRKEISPTSSDAPRSIIDALQLFFGISQGSLQHWSSSEERIS
jgi:hypothetical protein